VRQIAYMKMWSFPGKNRETPVKID